MTTSGCRWSAEQAAAKLRAAGLRVEIDLRNEKINYKVREHSLAKVPVIAVVGRREAEEGKLALRRLGSDGQTILMLDEAISTLVDEATPPDLKREKGIDHKGQACMGYRRGVVRIPDGLYIVTALTRGP